MADLDREVLFSNEALVIGMLQAVSGGSILGVLAQLNTLFTYAGRTASLLLLSAMAIALGLAVLAAYWKHQYKMWDVKAGASQGQAAYLRMRKQDADADQHDATAEERAARSSRLLRVMRGSITLSVVCILFALTTLVASVWTNAPVQIESPNNPLQRSVNDKVHASMAPSTAAERGR